MEINKKDIVAIKKSNKATTVQELLDEDLHLSDTNLETCLTESDKRTEELEAFQAYLEEMKEGRVLLNKMIRNSIQVVFT